MGVKIKRILLTVFWISHSLQATLKDQCIDGSTPEKDKSGNILWCSNNTECAYGRDCQPTGESHFGTSVGFCCLTRAQRCQLPLNPGYGDCFKPAVQRYYFDSTELRCKMFMYIDCVGGNENRFETMQKCKNFCENTACDIGEVTYVSNEEALLCEAEGNKCPQGSKCKFDPLFRRHVCCGHPKKETCPTGYLAYSEPSTGSVRACQPSSLTDGCPADFFCISQGAIGYCCTPEGEICPMGHKAYLHPVSAKTLKCDPLLSPTTCPNRHECFAAVPGARWGICCSQKLVATCPESTLPFIDHLSKQPVVCTVNVTLCPHGHICQGKNPKDIIGFCCTYNARTTQKVLSEITMHSKWLHNNERSALGAPEFLNTDGKLIANDHESLRDILEEHGLWQKSSEEDDQKPIRLIDIQKEIDHSPHMNSRTNNGAYSLVRQTTPKSSSFKYLECPGDALPVYYPGTQLLVECSSTGHRGFECPESSECVLAQNDLFGRSVCCTPAEFVASTVAEVVQIRTQTPFTRPPRIISVDSTEHEKHRPYPVEQFVYTVTLKTPDVPTERTFDPFCPRMVKDRTCLPGRHEACPEYKFYCQYNIQHRDFRCCSLDFHA